MTWLALRVFRLVWWSALLMFPLAILAGQRDLALFSAWVLLWGLLFMVLGGLAHVVARLLGAGHYNDSMLPDEKDE